MESLEDEIATFPLNLMNYNKDVSKVEQNFIFDFLT